MMVEQALPRKRSRKITPTVARVLTEQDYQTYQGVIQTVSEKGEAAPGWGWR
jgi:hypothetical protein